VEAEVTEASAAADTPSPATAGVETAAAAETPAPIGRGAEEFTRAVATGTPNPAGGGTAEIVSVADPRVTNASAIDRSESREK